ncbi:MAG: hypothetical protein IJH86_04650 [Clostridia bacterium]|nr:hypothetical protein [Clostridia bacterium]
MKHTPMKRMLALLLALLLALSTIALAEEAVEAPVEAGEVIQEAEPTNPDEPAGEVPAADDAADNADDAADDAADTADDAAGDADADADDGEIVAAVAAEDVSVSAEAVDAVIEEEEEELIDEEAVEEEVELVDEEEVDDLNISPVSERKKAFLILIGGYDLITQPDFDRDEDGIFEVPKDILEDWGSSNDASMTYNSNNNILTLNNVTIDGGYYGLMYIYGNDEWSPVAEAALYGMSVEDNDDTVPTLTIVLKGTNTIISYHAGIAGIYQDDNQLRGYSNSRSMPLCITGGGTLNINSSEQLHSEFYGIKSSNLSIEDSVDGSPTINITAGKTRGSFGIYAENMSVTGGKLTAQSKGTNAEEDGGAAGVILFGTQEESGKLTLGSNMQLKYGQDASSATVETAEKFNELIKEMFETFNIEKIPLYVHIEPKPTNPDTPAAPAAPAGRPDPSFPIDTLFFATVVSDSEDAHALKLAWTPANNVDGYDVFLKRCNAKKKEPFKLVGTSTGLECKITGLKKSKCYKGYVQPYVMEGSVKKYVLEPSKRFHVYTNNGRKGLSNPANVKVKYSKAEKKAGLDTAKKKTVPLGKIIKIKADVTGAKTGKVIEHVAKLRLYPSDPTVVKVVRKKGKNGKKGYVGLKGVGEGTCKVYVLTNNGICDYFTIKVTPAAVANAGKKKGKK